MRSGASARRALANEASRSRSGWSTGSPRAIAISLIAGGAVRRPRPRGRSGWHTTPTTGSARPSNASRMGPANRGVPMKTMRQTLRGRSDEEGASRAAALPSLACELAAARPVEVALQARQPIEEERSVEVIDLVLQRHRQQLLGLDLHLALLRSPATHEHAPGALDRSGQLGDGEAAFFPYDLALALGDLGIDEAETVLAGLRVVGPQVEHDHPAIDSDLRGRETDAGLVVETERARLAAELRGELVRCPLHRGAIAPFHPDVDEAREGRVAERAASFELGVHETDVVVTHGGGETRVIGAERLHHDAPRRRAASCATRHLDEELQGPLGGTEVGHVEREVGDEHRDQRDAGHVVPLAHHLRAD